ncbi:MAG: hypothetical protein ACLU30_05595 [Odoribacter splanchnicus]
MHQIEHEQLAGLYSHRISEWEELQEAYNERLKLVQQGEYRLDEEPIHALGFSHKHSLLLEGMPGCGMD